MPNQNTHADALAGYLTGAGSDGGVQTDPDASLGNYRSSTVAIEVAHAVTNPITNITVDEVAGANGLGAGSLISTGADTVTWTPPSGSAGTAVTILNGETKVVEGGGGAPEKHIVISRSTASALTGTATVTITESVNNQFGLDDVSSAEQSAGDDEYRAFCVRNEHASAGLTDVKVRFSTLGTQRTTDVTQLGGAGAGTIKTAGSFADWPAQGYGQIKNAAGAIQELVYYTSRTGDELTVPAAGRGLGVTSASAGASNDTVDAVPGFEMAIEAPSAQPSGNVQTIANEDTAPSAVSFTQPIVDADALSIGSLAAGYIYFVWLHRITPAGSTASTGYLNHVVLKFDAA